MRHTKIIIIRNLLDQASRNCGNPQEKTAFLPQTDTDKCGTKAQINLTQSRGQGKEEYFLCDHGIVREQHE